LALEAAGLVATVLFDAITVAGVLGWSRHGATATSPKPKSTLTRLASKYQKDEINSSA